MLGAGFILGSSRDWAWGREQAIAPAGRKCKCESPWIYGLSQGLLLHGGAGHSHVGCSQDVVQEWVALLCGCCRYVQQMKKQL